MFSLILTVFLGLAQSPDLSGTWERDDQLSQSAFEKIEMALGPGPAQGTRRGLDMLKDMSQAELRGALLHLASVLHTTEIEQSEKDITIAIGDDYFRIFYLDGEKHTRELEGMRLEATAAWDGELLRVEQKGVGGGATLRETYSLSSEGNQLAVLFELQHKAAKTPITFRTVYNRAGSR